METQKTIPLFELIPQTVEFKHFYTNGLSKIIPRLSLKVHSDPEQCYRLWNKFTSKKTLFDLWDFRYAWQKAFGYKMYFYTLYEGRRVLGTLPLWYNEKEKRYEFLGGYWMEQNSFFVEDEKLIDLLLTVAPAPISLFSIDEFDKMRDLHLSEMFRTDCDLKYTKNIENYKSMESLLRLYTKKHRYNIRADYHRIMRLNPNIEMIESKDVSYMADVTTLNRNRFNGVIKEPSVYDDEKETDAFNNTVRNAGLYNCKFVRVSIDGRLAASDLIIDHNGTYYQMTGGNDVMRYNGIGTFMVYIELEDAINNGYKLVDCLQEDHTWKHRYFDSRPVWEFVREEK